METGGKVTRKRGQGKREGDGRGTRLKRSGVSGRIIKESGEKIKMTDGGGKMAEKK